MILCTEALYPEPWSVNLEPRRCTSGSNSKPVRRNVFDARKRGLSAPLPTILAVENQYLPYSFTVSNIATTFSFFELPHRLALVWKM